GRSRRSAVGRVRPRREHARLFRAQAHAHAGPRVRLTDTRPRTPPTEASDRRRGSTRTGAACHASYGRGRCQERPPPGRAGRVRRGAREEQSMSPNAPVPPPPPPPGGVPGGAAGRDDVQATTAFSPPVHAVPPSFSPTSGPTAQAPRTTPAGGQPTVVASPFQPATVQQGRPITRRPTAAQPAVPAPAPPQRVRYATEQNGFGVAAPVGTAASRPSYPAADAAPTGYGATSAYPAATAAYDLAPHGGYGSVPQQHQQHQQPQPAYHPPASVAPAGAAARTSAGPAGGSTPPPASGGGEARGGGGRGRRSDRLSPGWIAFIVVDALLVLGAIVFAISLVGGGNDDPAGGAT